MWWNSVYGVRYACTPYNIMVRGSVDHHIWCSGVEAQNCGRFQCVSVLWFAQLIEISEHHMGMISLMDRSALMLLRLLRFTQHKSHRRHTYRQMYTHTHARTHTHTHTHTHTAHAACIYTQSTLSTESSVRCFQHTCTGMC